MALSFPTNKQYLHPSDSQPQILPAEDIGTTEKGIEGQEASQKDSHLRSLSSGHIRDEASTEVDITMHEATGGSPGDGQDPGSQKENFFSRFYSKYRLGFHIALWLVWTAWWIYGLITYRNSPKGWLIPFLLYLAITVRLIFFWFPSESAWKPVQCIWKHTFRKLYAVIPPLFRQPLAALFTFAVYLIGTFIPVDEGSNTRVSRTISLFGLIVMISVLYATSRDRKAISWHTVIGGMLTQYVIALFVLKTSVGYDIFEFISGLARTLLHFANEGVVFLTDTTVPKLPWFLIGVIPAIIFFVSLVTLLYHFRILQWFIYKVGNIFFWTLHVSGAEAVVAASTPFVGQGESAMLIRPFIPYLTYAEIHQIMTCGFATISGSMLVAYIGLGLNPQALVSSCIMSIPASLAISKLRYPETEETLTSGKIIIPELEEDQLASNALHAFANGAWLGLKIAGMIVATLLCIIAFVSLVNGFLTWWGGYWGISNPSLTLQLIFGYLMYPVAWLLGVPSDDLRPVAELIGLKVITNEFVAFSALSQQEPYISMDSRSQLIATYACCGFGNIGSLGTQIGILSQLAPGRAGAISQVAVSALISGIIATLTSASVAGMLYTTSN